MSSSQEVMHHHPDFLAVKQRVIAATGMVYFHDKDEAILSAALRAFKLTSQDNVLSVFAKILKNQDQEFNALIDELTIGETFFFRHTEMFDALRGQILPDIIQRNSAHRLIRIWSAGCSIGAEPYSISILLHDLLGPEAIDWKIEIVGSDINHKFLRSAVKGVFAPWALRGVSEAMLQKYFDRHEGQWRLKSTYRTGVHFRYYNLIEHPENLAKDFYGLDLLVCRNVMIYFDVATNRRLVEAFHQCLRSQAWLLVGHAENHHELYRKFQVINAQGAVLYRKSDAAQVSPTLVLPPKKLDLTMPRVASAQASLKANPSLPVARVAEATPRPAPSRSTEATKSAAFTTHDAIEQRILQHCDAGAFETALQLVESELALQLKNSDLYYLRGMIHAQLGHWDHARQDFKSRLFYQRDCIMTHYQLALLPQERSQAEKHLRNADKLLSSLGSDDIIPLSGGLKEAEMRLIVHHQRLTLSA